MARITVEDCLANVPSRFELVLFAAQRSRELSVGAEPTVPLERDKPTVVALRELAAGSISPDRLRETLITRMRRPAAVRDALAEDDAFAIDGMADAFAETFGAAGAPANDDDDGPEPETSRSVA